METRRLRFLSELDRLGSMTEVAEALGVTTSTVSQQIALLSRDAGTPLTEPEGRRVRLTPAGRRLARHAVSILAAVESARLDLDPEAEPAGTLRVAGFSTALRESVLPLVSRLASSRPRLRLLVREHEPPEALALLAADEVDLALTYDYSLAPAPADHTVESSALWTLRWGLGVPAKTAGTTDPADGAGTADSGSPAGTGSPAVFARFREADWIVNSRNSADENVIRVLASTAGFEPRISHMADSLDLVQEMIAAGLGVGLLPHGRPTGPGVRLIGLSRPAVEFRSYAVTRRGRRTWPPLALVTALLTEGGDTPAPADP